MTVGGPRHAEIPGVANLSDLTCGVTDVARRLPGRRLPGRRRLECAELPKIMLGRMMIFNHMMASGDRRPSVTARSETGPHRVAHQAVTDHGAAAPPRADFGFRRRRTPTVSPTADRRTEFRISGDFTDADLKRPSLIQSQLYHCNFRLLNGANLRSCFVFYW